ncbi:uncharacterized protein EDB91DRAFT_1348688 [Suillus paluster]|uniref:uncharacterized protein n=1 Tax=Suillus paluster TaxID=48578 RepID=UPI001B86C35A|nr:uncharacterized protein EDB91DRAFT_1348688 [Suillus paluster]KAG1733887.1 hypothetical protein EDB91DRAFT_1348688 [Suillus paluster]
MDDGEREQAHNWLLADDNRLFFLTFSSLALAVASILLWRAKYVDNYPVNDNPDSQQAHSILTAALSTFHIASHSTPGEFDMTVPEKLGTPEAATSATTELEQKASRSKERRRRGKVPYKEIIKGGKKTKSTPKATQSRLPAHSRSESPALEMESKSSSSSDNIVPVAPSTSSLASPASDLPEEHLVSPLSAESPPAGEPHEDRSLPACMTASSSEPASVSRHNTVTSHNSAMRTSRSEHTQLHGTVDNVQPASSPCHHDPAPSIPELSSPTTSTAPLSEDHDSHERVSSFTSYSQSQSMPLHASTSTHALDWDGQSQAYTADALTKPPRLTPKQRGADKSNGSCAILTSISHSTLLASSSASHSIPPARITVSNSASASSSPLYPNPGSTIGLPPSPSGTSPQPAPSPTLPHFTFPTLNPLQASPNDHTHTHLNTIESPIMNGKKAAGPPIPSASRGSTPPPGVFVHTAHIGSPAGPLSAQTQLASMRGALEAARLREEKARAEAEHLGKENEELKWRWNEDAMAWRRREAELQAQVHHLMQQLQAAYSVLTTLQTQAQAQAQSPAQSSSSFSSPTSPSPRLHPHSPNLSHNSLPPTFSHNPPAHVQALLASSYHPYPGFPGAYGGTGMSPLFFSGLRMTMSPGSNVRNGSAGGGKDQYTPDTSSSVGSSPSRGRRRRRGSESSSTEENIGEGIVISEAEEDQEDIWQNSILADAILKRPESLRVPSRGSLRSDGRKSAMGGGMSGKEDVGRVPSRMSERSDASTSGGSYGMSMSSLSWGKSEDEAGGVVGEGGSTSAEGTTAGGEGTSDSNAPTHDPSMLAPAKDVQ